MSRRGTGQWVVHDGAPLDPLHCALEGAQLVEASAGTGKTWNLCVLFLRLLLERGLALSQILVVTFTKAATAELQTRIRQRLLDVQSDLIATESEPGGALAGLDPFTRPLIDALMARGLARDLLLDRVRAGLAAFDEASIFTIHGFCQRALGDVAFAAGMPLDIEIDADGDRWATAAARDFWRRHLVAATLARPLALELALRQDSPERLGRLLARRLSRPLATLRWPEGIDAPPDVDEAALQAAHDGARAAWTHHRDSAVQSVLDALQRLKGQTYKEAAVQASADAWDKVLREEDALAALQTQPQKLELLGEAALLAGCKGGQRPPQHAFYPLAQRLLDQRHAARQAMALQRSALLRRFLEEGVEHVRVAKRAKRVIGYDDVLSELHERLVSPGSGRLAALLRARFPAALIDEFQDTDPIQFGIFQALYGGSGRPLFLVGDPKQAIYRFRSADLHTYFRASRQAQTRHALLTNQRSTPELIKALNALFTANPRAFMLEGLRFQPVSPGDKPRLVFADPAQALAPLQLWWLREDPQTGQPLTKDAAKVAAATACAHEIARLLDQNPQRGARLDGAPLQAGHIAVLVVTHREGRLMRQALAAVGVGSVQLSPDSVWSSDEAEDAQRLLAAVLEPTHSGLVRTALATPAFGLDAQALEVFDDDEPAAGAWTERFERWRQTWWRRGVGVMLRQWMTQQQVAERLLPRPEGARRLTNWLHLVELIHEASLRETTPEALLRWVEAQRQDESVTDAQQLRLETDRLLVQIITIHRAKGLEYPVVFCPFLWDGLRRPSATLPDGVEVHDAQGQVVWDMRPQDTVAEDESSQIAVARALEDTAERLRLIYVALTRAQHRCVVVAGPYGRRTRSGMSLKEYQGAVLNWLVAGVGLEPRAWLSAPPAAPAIASAWQALAACGDGVIGLAPLPEGQDTPQARASTIAGRLQTPPLPVVGSGWRIGSYSGLVLGSEHEAWAADHDLPSESVAPAADLPLQGPPDDILGFARGAAAGTCLHAVFESIDFTQDATWAPAIQGALRRAGALRHRPGSGEPARMLRQMLHNVLHTPLEVPGTSPLVLGALPMQRRLTELEFHLPADTLRADELNDALARWGYPTPQLDFVPLRGFVKGFIDLVFEHEGRYFLLDWKSNHLGDAPADYEPASLAIAMARQGYHLQHLLYAVALDRFLMQRLPNYDPARHWGGVLYLFVRGVRPTWRDVNGAACGLFAHRADPEVVQALSRMVGGRGAGGR